MTVTAIVSDGSLGAGSVPLSAGVVSFAESAVVVAVPGAVASIVSAPISVLLTVLPPRSVTSTWISYVPSVRAGVIVLSASVQVPSPLLVAA